MHMAMGNGRGSEVQYGIPATWHRLGAPYQRATVRLVDENKELSVQGNHFHVNIS